MEESDHKSGCVLCGAPLARTGDTMCAKCLKQSENKAKKHRERPVGGARTPFGTRIATAINCSNCGKRDHIGFKPKPGAQVLCRDCAVEMLGRREEGVKRPQDTRRVVCSLCGRQDSVPATLPDSGEVMCGDCYRGIYSHQKDRSKTAERRAGGTLLSRRRDKKKPPA